MTYGLRILPAADADVDNLALYIAQNSVAQASRFYDAIAATYKAIDSDMVEIVRVVHGARDLPAIFALPESSGSE